MREYIEREALLAHLQTSHKETIQLMKAHVSGAAASAGTLNGLIIFVQKIPAADVVEVVRCKDCKFWDSGRCEGIENGLIREYTSPDDFCSYGERRSEDA